jgi:hypothetical protein
MRCHTSAKLHSLVCLVLVLGGSRYAAAGNVDDTVFLKNGGRLRGLVVEESATAGVRLKMPDGSIRTIPAKDVEHVTLGAQAPAPPPAPVGTARLRVRATCAKGSSVLGVREGLRVEETGADPARALQPAGSDPQFIDYELPSGSHSLRLSATRCAPLDAMVTLPAGVTIELSPHLEAAPIPSVSVAFARPAFLEANETISVEAPDGKVVCPNVPCTASVPTIEQSYTLKWTKESGKVIVAALPDPGGEEKTSVAADILYSKGIGVPGPVLVGVGGVVALLGLLTLANNGGNNADGVNRSGNRAAGTYVAIGGAVVLAAGVVMMVTRLGGREKLSVVLSGHDKEPVRATVGLRPDGFAVAF